MSLSKPLKLALSNTTPGLREKAVITNAGKNQKFICHHLSYLPAQRFVTSLDIPQDRLDKGYLV